MYSSSILLATLAAATSVSANMQALEIPYPERAIRRVEARQTDSDYDYYTDYDTATADPGCASATEAILSMVTDLPTPAADLESWAYTAYVTDECSFSVPSSLSSDYSVYSSEVLSWYDAHSSEISSAIAECTELAGDASSLPVCTSDGAVASATASATGDSGSSSETGSSSSKTTAAAATTSSSSSSSSSSKTSSSSSATAVATAGAAIREVGLVGAVFAGVLGAAIAL